jgi:hypothetical protein
MGKRVCPASLLVPRFSSMSSVSRTLLLVSFFFAAALAFAKEREETVFVFQNRKVSFVLPENLGFASTKDDAGRMTVHIADQKEKVSLQMTFLADLDEQFTSARSRKELMADTFRDNVENSVEKAMQFEELEPKFGAGTYCVFTDARLAGKAKLPRGEFLHATTGVKAWPGVAAVFSIYCNDTNSKEYQAVMNLLRDSVQEKPLYPIPVNASPSSKSRS